MRSKRTPALAGGIYHFEASPTSVGLLLLVAVIDSIANYFYFKTFEKTEASVATPILSLAPAFAFMLSWLVLSEAVSLRTLVLSAAIIVTVVIFSVDFKNVKRFHKESLIPALLSSVLFGISAIPSKALLSELEAINPPTLFMFRAALISIVVLLVFKSPPVKQITSRQYGLIFSRGLLVIAQWVLLYYALTLGNAGGAVTLANTTPIFVFIFSALFLSERPTLKKALAAGLIIGLSLLL